MEDVAAGGISSRLFYDLWELPRRLRSENFRAIVSLTNFGPIWSSARHILFQTNALYFCEQWLKGTSASRRVSEVLRGRYALAGMKRARFIVTPSRAMAAAILRRMPELRNKDFRVLYHGFAPGSMDEPLEEAVRDRLNTGAVKLVYLTHPAPHKGFDVAFRTLRELQRRGIDATLYTTFDRQDWPKLVRQYEHSAQKCLVRDRVVFLGNVPPAQVGDLLKKSSVFIWPSLVESFGFPLLEAMGSRVPIVAAGTEVNREICGDAALYYSPLNAMEFADTVERALCPGEQARLRRECDQRMKAFDWSWDRYAREFVQIIRDAC
jgi:glycosyltransferase involved in cell wall biosynthesis